MRISTKMIPFGWWLIAVGVILLILFFKPWKSSGVKPISYYNNINNDWAPYNWEWERFTNAGPTFTMFGTDWCPACKASRPIFDSMGPTVTIGDKTVSLQFVNPETQQEQAKGYDIAGYPTFYLDSGTKRLKYSGPRTVDGFRQFLQTNL